MMIYKQSQLLMATNCSSVEFRTKASLLQVYLFIFGRRHAVNPYKHKKLPKRFPLDNYSNHFLACAHLH